MDGSRIARSRLVKTTVLVTSSVAEAKEWAEVIWKSPGILVLDGNSWTIPLSEARQYLDSRHRKFDSPFSLTETPKEVVDSFSSDIHRLFCNLFPSKQPLDIRKSWRPMSSGPEPLHFDTFASEDATPITAYVNVSMKPREYGVSHDFETTLRLYSKTIREMEGPIRSVDHLCVRLRLMGLQGKGPLGRSAPRHKVWFAPGSIWFFNPKKVSHELLFGDGAYCYSWMVAKEGKSTQEIFQEVLG